MKKVIIISSGKKTANSLKYQLESILGKKIDIASYCIDDHILEKLECDLIIFSSYIVKDIIFERYNIKYKYIVARRVIKHQSIYELINLAKDENVLIVNDHMDTCETVINQLKTHGIDHINYYPYYPKIKDYKKLDIAITPGESQLAPSCVSKVIDIGSREMDVTSIVEVLINLDCIDEYGDLLSAYFFRNMVSISKRYINMANHSNKFKNILKDIIDNSEEGIIYTNTKDEVLVLNKKSLDILKLDKENIISKKIYDVCKNLQNDIATINEQEVFISRQPIYSENLLVGYIITIDTVENIEKMDEELRRKKKDKKVQAKYTFEDMIGSSVKTMKTVKLAKKIAKTNSTVLIQGESGTGKEILAQAIHNHSDRTNYPFVAINFAALSESLLESELFGYEEGSFTGAKKGGKVGLFKKAHKGTIFLDEIGDAPYHFQSRLLRVLQEREVTPVGGSEIIPIDVRVIVATNKNLLKEIENNNFREDLFYRINVMPISTVALRDRKEDIETLIKYYLKKNKIFINLNDFLDEATLEYLKNYNWRGNIRELINVVEYLINIREDEKFKIDDLPSYMIQECTFKEDKVDDNIIWILNKINKHENIGRRSLSIIAKEEGIDLGEGKIRSLMSKMQNEELIKVNIGVRGAEILSKGEKVLRR